MTNRDAESNHDGGSNRDAVSKQFQSRSDDGVEPGASAPGEAPPIEMRSPGGATSDRFADDVAPTGLDADARARNPGARAPGYTMSPVPGCDFPGDSPCVVDEQTLLDYADGELTGNDAQTVGAHVDGCPRCRQRVAALRASLEMARDIWREAAAVARDVTPRTNHNRWRAAAALAGTAAAVLIGWWWITSGDHPRGHAPQQPMAQNDNARSPDVTRDESPPWNDVEAIIARQERSARLAVAVRALADDPQLKPYHDNARRYLAKVVNPTDGPGASVKTPGTEQEI